MSAILLSAVSSGFFMARVVKGPWLRNPQYVAAAIVGAIVAALALHMALPDTDGDFVFPTLACLAGSLLAILGFDLVLGAA